jgi:ABC-type phosphate/phosphonate transport system permease subunit
MNSVSDASANVVRTPVITVPQVQSEQKRKSQWIFWVLVILVIGLIIWALTTGKGLGIQCYKLKNLSDMCQTRMTQTIAGGWLSSDMTDITRY